MRKPFNRTRALRTVRLSEPALNALLDDLDARAETALKGKRRQSRFRYRLTACVVHMQQPGDAEEKAYLTPTRDLSARGLAFLHGGYVHVGTKVFLQLQGSRPTSVDVRGRVVHAEYVGSGLYQIGVCFEQEISPAEFCEEAQAHKRRVLVVDDDASVGRLCVLLLRQLHADAEHVLDATSGVEKALAGCYDLILLDMEMPGLDGFAAAKALRTRGYRGAIVATTALNRPGDRELCLEAGCDGYISKPYCKADLSSLLDKPKCAPLLSAYADDPLMIDLIDEFVVDLSGRIRLIEEAFRVADVAALERLIRNLKAEGASYGFEPISALASAFENQLRSPFDPQSLETPLHELLEMCRLVRASSSPPNPPTAST